MNQMTVPLLRRLFAEGLGTAILLATVVGSGIMAERLAGGNQAIALLGYNPNRRNPCCDHYHSWSGLGRPF
jgi:glycerol uptake facilitator-like aquaporin